MIIKYGIVDNNIDVTDICYNKLCNNNIITIHEGDHNREKYFGDPLFGVLHLLTFQTPILDVVFTTALFTYFPKELKL